LSLIVVIGLWVILGLVGFFAWVMCKAAAKKVPKPGEK